MVKVYFKEKQRYENKVLLTILAISCIAALLGGVKRLVASHTDYPQTIFLFFTALAIGVIIWWLTKLKMKVNISNKRIKFKMTPIHIKKQSIFWEDIEKCEIVRTSEAAQWSGGNITFNHEKRISLNGRNGLALKTKKGEHYFIGCKNISRLQQALDKIQFGS